MTLAGEAAIGPITRDIAKNQGIIPLFVAADVISWFTVSDTRPECAIQSYIILNSNEATPEEPLIT